MLLNFNSSRLILLILNYIKPLINSNQQQDKSKNIFRISIYGICNQKLVNRSNLLIINNILALK